MTGHPQSPNDESIKIHERISASMQKAVEEKDAFFVINPARTILAGDLQWEQIQNRATQLDPLGPVTTELVKTLAPMVVYVTGRDPSKLNGDGKSLEDLLGPEGAKSPRVACNGMTLGLPDSAGRIDDKIIGPSIPPSFVAILEKVSVQHSGVVINKKPDPSHIATVCYNGSSLSADDWGPTAAAAMREFERIGNFGFIAKRKDGKDQIIEVIPDPEKGISRASGVIAALDGLKVSKKKNIFVIGYDADPNLDAGIAPVLCKAGYTMVTDISVGSKPYGDINYPDALALKTMLLYPALKINSEPAALRPPDKAAPKATIPRGTDLA